MRKVITDVGDAFPLEDVLCVRPLSGPSYMFRFAPGSFIFSLLQVHSDWYDPECASALRQETIQLIELNKLIYKKTVLNCLICEDEGHESLVKKFEHAFSS